MNVTNKAKGRVEGKVAIITGAASGIGRAAAIIFAKEGAKLVLADMQEQALNETLAIVKKEGGDAVAKKTNVAVEQDIIELISLAMKIYSHVDIVCNNAGITGSYAGPEQQDGKDWIKVYEVNVLGAVYTTKHVAAHMQA